MDIRKVTPEDDFDAIGDIYAESWRTAYRGMVQQDYLDALTGAHWAEALRKNGRDAFVSVQDGKYIGTASVTPARDAGMDGWGELISIYLLPEYFGCGVAAPLLDYALGALRETGFADVYLWVLEGNLRARGFYEKHGFALTGDTERLEIAGDFLTAVRYIRHLED